MPDREKVIKWLNVCKTSHYAVGIKEDYPCRLCPYYEKEYCMKELISDALAMLKEQQNQIWEMQDRAEYLEDKLKEQPEVVQCKDCKHGYQLFADYISCEISEENESGCHVSHKPDWFCADGERK